MVKSDTVLTRGKDSSRISIVSDGRLTPRIQMRKKLSIQPSFKISNGSYTPEYPWIVEPGSTPQAARTWKWQSTARAALFVVVIAAAFSLVFYCGLRIVRGKAPPQALELQRPQHGMATEAPQPPPGSGTAGDRAQEPGMGAQTIRIAFSIIEANETLVNESDGIADQGTINANVTMIVRENPSAAHIGDSEFTLSLSITPEGDPDEASDAAVTNEETEFKQGEEVQGLSDLDKALLLKATEIKGDDGRQIFVNLMKSAGLMSEEPDVVNSVVHDGNGESNKQPDNSSSALAETTEGDMAPLMLGGEVAVSDPILLKSAGQTSEVAEVEGGDAFKPSDYDNKRLRMAGMTSEMVEVEKIQALESNDNNKRLRMAGLTSEMAEVAASQAFEPSDYDKKRLRLAAETSETAEFQNGLMRSTEAPPVISDTVTSVTSPPEQEETDPSKVFVLFGRLINLIQHESELAERVQAFKEHVNDLRRVEEEISAEREILKQTSFKNKSLESAEGEKLDGTTDIPHRPRMDVYKTLRAMLRMFDLLKRQRELLDRVRIFKAQVDTLGKLQEELNIQADDGQAEENAVVTNEHQEEEGGLNNQHAPQPPADDEDATRVAMPIPATDDEDIQALVSRQLRVSSGSYLPQVADEATDPREQQQPDLEQQEVDQPSEGIFRAEAALQSAEDGDARSTVYDLTPGEPSAHQGQDDMYVPLLTHVLVQREQQRVALQQQQRALAYLQLLDLHRRHHQQEEEARRLQQENQQAADRLAYLTEHGMHHYTDSAELVSKVLGVPVEPGAAGACPCSDCHPHGAGRMVTVTG